MERIEKITRLISSLFNWVALSALAAMLLIVTADIIGAKIFSRPLRGAMDLVSLVGLLLIAFSVTQTFLMGRHIKVDFVSILLPYIFRKIIRIASSIICLLFFTIATWRIFAYAYYFQTRGDSSLTVNIPLAPFAYALGVAFMPMLMALLVQTYNAWKGRE